MRTPDKLRRKLLTAALVTATSIALFPSRSFALLSTPRPRFLKINNIHTGEMLTTEFFDGKHYNKQELARLNFLFRDHRTNQIEMIEPTLFDLLYRIQLLLKTVKPIQLVSGYRSFVTNEKLRARSKGVAKKSYHSLGKAVDFYIEGIDLSFIRQAAMQIKAGGVGFYPRSNFVHIDTGPIRSW